MQHETRRQANANHKRLPTAIHSIAKQTVGARYAPSAPTKADMLGAFMRAGLTQAEASGEALLQIIAGTDTSASTIRTMLLCLMTNPASYAALQREIDSAIASGRISSPIRDSEARRLPYLQACIRESLRIIPPALSPFFKQVPPRGDNILGFHVPGGTQIGESALALQRNKEIFGEDADFFVPERWLVPEGKEDEATAARLSRMAATVDLVFHYGKWQCLGKPVALMEFNKVFVEVRRSNSYSPLKKDRHKSFSGTKGYPSSGSLVR